ncbi:hypothetical protein COI90_31770, partial [Bacillus cereus]
DNFHFDTDYSKLSDFFDDHKIDMHLNDNLKGLLMCYVYNRDDGSAIGLNMEMDDNTRLSLLTLIIFSRYYILIQN